MHSASEVGFGGCVGAPRSYKFSRRHKSAQVLETKHPLLALVEKGQVAELAVFLEEERTFLTRQHLDQALHQAAAQGHVATCKLLLAAGADVNVREDPFEHEFRHQASDAFSAEQGHSFAWVKGHTAVGGTPLHRAVEGSHIECVKFLLSQGAKVNNVDTHDVTPLMLAAMRRGSADLIRCLTFMPGCKVKVRDKLMGRTALHYAAHAGDQQALEILIKEGADLDVNDDKHNSPIHLVCSPFTHSDPRWPPRQELPCLQLLVKQGCFVNLFNIDGETPLHRAVELGNEHIVDYLLDHNAIVYPDLIRTAALSYKSTQILYSLLDHCSRIEEELLIVILIVLISTENSQWMLDRNACEEMDHKMARMLIKSVYDFEGPLSNVLSKGDIEMQELFGIDHYGKIDKDILADIHHYGLMGLALKKGKASIAQMLYLSGCTPHKHAASRYAPFTKPMFVLPATKRWLPSAISAPSSLKLLCRQAVRSVYRDEAFIVVREELVNYIELEDLDNIRPQDLGISIKREMIMDVAYGDRESAKAAAQQTLWLYSNWEQ